MTNFYKDVVIVIVVILFTGIIVLFSFERGVSDGKKQDRLLSNEENRTVLKSLRNTNNRLESLNHDMQTKIVLLEKVIGLIEGGKIDKEVKKGKGKK